MTTVRCDVAVFGATPGGILAAVTAARYGHRVALVTQANHVGGLLSNGVSVANIRHRHVHGAPFDEFARAVVQAYVNRHGPDSPLVEECRGGTRFEPHVAEAVFEDLLARESGIELLRNRRLVAVRRDGRRVRGFAAQDRNSGGVDEIEAAVTVDATYEGDLAAAAGAAYRVGREARSEFWEPHAGEIYVGRDDEVLPESTGAADGRIQAYCYRLSVTQRPEMRVAFPKPDRYEREWYRHVIRAIEQGRVHQLRDVMGLGPHRVRVNAKGDVIANYVGGADAYPEADESARIAIAQRHRDYTLGLFWFLQHDEVVPPAVREEAQSWGLARDEYPDNGHFPRELYVREARRIAGRAIATEHDFLLQSGKERSPLHADAVAVADYVIDSHPTQVLAVPPYSEGHLNVKASQPGQMRYGSLLPVNASGHDVPGLLVPVALSSTHVAFSVIRMEPVWMALGAVAATAAHLSLAANVLPDALPVERLQMELARRDHRLAFFHDVPLELSSRGLQFFATKGFFDTFYARPNDPVTRSEAARWIARCLDLQGEGGPPANASSAGAAPAYPDVPPGHPDWHVVARLHDLGIVDPWLDSEGFCPAAHLRRCDAARWLAALSPLWRMRDIPEAAAPNGPDRPYLPVRRAAFCDQLFDVLTARSERH